MSTTPKNVTIVPWKITSHFSATSRLEHWQLQVNKSMKLGLFFTDEELFKRKSIYIAPFGQGGTLKALRLGSHSFTCK